MKAFGPLVLACAVVLSLAACFGDNDGADGPRLQDVVVPSSVDAEGGAVELIVRVHGQPAQVLTIELVNALGTFTPPALEVITDAAGAAEAAVRFTAGDAPGTQAGTATVTDPAGGRARRDFSLTVTPISRVGQATAFAATEAVDLGFFEGQPITVATAGRLRRLGVFAPGTVEVMIGLYTDVAGIPTNLVAQATGTLQRGRNELPVPDAALPVGTYWFMASYRTASSLYVGAATAPTRYVSRAYSTVAPATYPESALYNDGVRNYFLVLGE